MSVRTSGSIVRRPSRRKEEGTWAVSYADFLMVLLSFFILFFSSTPKTLMHTLVQDFDGSTKEVHNTPSSVENRTPAMAIANDLKEQLKLDSQSVVSNGERITIILQNDIFKNGGYRAPVDELNRLVSVLKKHESEVKITVVGFSDTSKFKNEDATVVSDNLSLASIRAAYSAKYLSAQLPQIKIQARNGENSERSTRSLNIIIEPSQEVEP